MKRANKDSVVNICLLLIGIVGLIFSVISNSSKNEVNGAYKETEKVNKEQFAMYIEDENGNYIEYESNSFPSGYVLNMDNSQCIDINNNLVDGALSNVDNSVTITSNKTVFCYLYFDDYMRLATKIVRLVGQTSGNGTVINENGYRYSGVDPNNYIEFNNELWRIIGIVDGYVKLIRNESLGDFIWDGKKTGAGSSTSAYGSNDWTDSQLMMMLNPSEYLKEGYTISNNLIYDLNGRITYSHMGLYYNRTSGYKPASVVAGVSSYSGSSVDFSSTGLTEESRNMIQENTWYLGDPLGSGTGFVSAAQSYLDERNEQFVYGDNSATWRGKVGLMYASDHYYANNNYYNDPETYDINADRASSCEDNWLCIGSSGNGDEWLLAVNDGGSYQVAMAFGGGSHVIYQGAIYEYPVRPVVYLKSGIKVTGEGTIGSKYQIVS